MIVVVQGFLCICRFRTRKSLKAIRDRIRARTGRTRRDSLRSIVAELNPMLQGWYGYFKHAHPWTFDGMDGFVRRRLRTLLRKQQKRPGAVSSFARCGLRVRFALGTASSSSAGSNICCTNRGTCVRISRRHGSGCKVRVASVSQMQIVLPVTHAGREINVYAHHP